MEKNITSMEIKSFYGLMDYVLMRKEGFGINSVMDLYLFYLGQKMTIMAKDIIDVEYEEFNKFNEFVLIKFDLQSTHSWASAINFFSAGALLTNI